MVELTSIPSGKYSKLDTEYLIVLNDENLGRTILIALVIEYNMSGEYLYCRQFLKTKFYNSQLQESQLSFSLFSCPDLNTFIDYCKNHEFYKFLEEFGNALITSGNIYTNISEIQQASKDLNIKLMIYDDDELVSEGISYEFPNPPTICIISQKKSDKEYIFPYSFTLKNKKQNPLIEINKKDEELKRLINNFGSSLVEITNKTLLNKQSKDWINDLLNKSPYISHEYPFLRQLKKVKVRAGKVPQLKTEKMEIALLKTSHSHVIAMPELFSKFAPIPEENIMPEMQEKGDDTGIKREVNKVEEIKSDRAAERNPPVQAAPSETGVHCDKCLNNPFEFGNFECYCLLSSECMQSSLMNGKCVSCKKTISPSDIEKFNLYF